LEAAIVMYREITIDQALTIRTILVEECRYRVHDRYDQFVDSIRTDNNPEHVCHEYRFMGALGFGGKFRNAARAWHSESVADHFSLDRGRR
jgi:hypothetical protein